MFVCMCLCFLSGYTVSLFSHFITVLMKVIEFETFYSRISYYESSFMLKIIKRKTMNIDKCTLIFLRYISEEKILNLLLFFHFVLLSCKKRVHIYIIIKTNIIICSEFRYGIHEFIWLVVER